MISDAPKTASTRSRTVSDPAIVGTPEPGILRPRERDLRTFAAARRQVGVQGDPGRIRASQ